MFVEDFYASRVAQPPKGGMELFSYMNTGYAGSLEEVKAKHKDF